MSYIPVTCLLSRASVAFGVVVPVFAHCRIPPRSETDMLIVILW